MKRILICGLLAIVPLLQVGQAQSNLSNADLIKLAKSGLSEDFILNMVETQGSRLASDPSSLIELKNSGLNERVLEAVLKKSPSSEPLNTDSIVRLSNAKFSDGFLLDLMERQPGSYSVSATRILDLKNAGVSERVLSAMVTQGGGRELPAGATISVRMIDAIDSERASEGDEFHASLEDPITMGNEVIAPKGSDARVRLTAEKESGKVSGKAALTVQLVSVTVDGKAIAVNSNDVSEYSGSRTARTAKSAAAVGAIGAVIGAIAGGGKGAAIGAGAGAAAGAGAQVFMKGQKVKIPSETVLTFTASAPVKIP